MTAWRTAVVTCALLTAALAVTVRGQAPARRVASPPGESATEIGGRHDERTGYVNGKWMYLKYGRPIKRGRDLFGPDDFADFLYDGAPVWRAGANFSTRLLTETPLEIGGKTIPPGEYTLFIEFNSRTQWTFILSGWRAQEVTYNEKDDTALFGAYGYTPEKDLVRMPMRVETLPYSFDQLSWQFLDMSNAGGRLAVLWDRQIASVPFRIPQ